MEKNSCVVELKGVSIYHTDGDAVRPNKEDELVLSDVNLRVEAGEMVYFIGRVGSGKSTLLKTLYAEVQLLQGEGYVVGMNLRNLRRKDIPYLRRKMGIVFQDYQLLDDRNVFYNLYDVCKYVPTLGCCVCLLCTCGNIECRVFAYSPKYNAFNSKKFGCGDK